MADDSAVEVAGGLKIGQFSLAFQDVLAPVAGVPLAVITLPLCWLALTRWVFKVRFKTSGEGQAEHQQGQAGGLGNGGEHHQQVVAAEGLGGFTGGLDIKRYLLGREA